LKNTPLVSIVTPSFNSDRFIEATVESVLRQDYPSVEHIVVDGCSTDRTLEILSAYPHLHVVSEPDKGQTDALIKGFGLARGKIFAWLNSDDFYYPGAIASAVEVLEATGAALVYGSCDVIDESGELRETRSALPYDFQQELEWGSKIMQPAAFFTRAAFESCGGLDPEVSFAMDYDLWLKLGKRFPVERIDRVVAAFRVTCGQRSMHPDAMPEVRRIARRHGAPFLSWRYLHRMEMRRPRLARQLYRVRRLLDLVRAPMARRGAR